MGLGLISCFLYRTFVNVLCVISIQFYLYIYIYIYWQLMSGLDSFFNLTLLVSQKTNVMLLMLYYCECVYNSSDEWAKFQLSMTNRGSNNHNKINCIKVTCKVEFIQSYVCFILC